MATALDGLAPTLIWIENQFQVDTQPRPLVLAFVQLRSARWRPSSGSKINKREAVKSPRLRITIEFEVFRCSMSD